MPNLTVFSYAMFISSPGEVCSFLKGKGGGMDLGEKNDGEGWEE